MGYVTMVEVFHQRDLVIRVSGDTLALIVTEDQIGELVDKTTAVIRALA